MVASHLQVSCCLPAVDGGSGLGIDPRKLDIPSVSAGVVAPPNTDIRVPLTSLEGCVERPKALVDIRLAHAACLMQVCLDIRAAKADSVALVCRVIVT